MLKDKSQVKTEKKIRIRKRIRKKIRGAEARPRVHVFKSNRYLYAQAVDDDRRAVLAAASSLEKTFKEKAKNTKNREACGLLGEILAQRLLAKNVKTIVFDRGRYPYHGRIKALAEGLRKGGLVF
ncbi:MAG: 50S ribosomal protein L18 [Candidatus Aminicenantes bacterium]|nr:50S ribosomal protein L18 [Candidatus Aminicenantes bacterium]